MSTGSFGAIAGGIMNSSSNNASTLIITNSTISHNIASSPGGSAGGGIYNGDNNAMLTLTNSTISDNEASDGNGGGIADGDQSSTTTLANSTFSGNKAANGGGIYALGSHDSIVFCTFFRNTATSDGGGIWTGNYPYSQKLAQVQMRNSIVAGDRANTGPDIAGILTSGGYNLIQNVSGATFAASQQHSTDIVVDSHTDLRIDPALRGKQPQVHALLAGSPAIDRIPLSTCLISGISTDERGVKRPDGQEQFCDIGAYEYMDV
jgi:hypothetical protein